MKKILIVCGVLLVVVAAVLADVELGTNSGFVATAPVADPADSTATIDVDGDSRAIKHTSPAGATSITEIGWWCDTATAEVNFEIALYDHDGGNDRPGNRIHHDDTNAKGTGSGWKDVAVDWAIDGSTIYWIAVGVEAQDPALDWGFTSAAGRNSRFQNNSALGDPWGGSAESTALFAFYAEYASGANVTILLPLDKSSEKSNFKNGGKQ